MKPIRLEIDGINSYSTKQSVNFEKLTSKGLFGIFGKTGSGKSTILDAITLALYGNIARGTREFINSNCEKGSVEYEFEIVEEGKRNRYIVKRRFKRNKENKNALSDYTLLQKMNECGEYDIIEEGKVSEVNNRIKSIIGLEESDFLRSVVLPQGKFSEFLTLGGKDRRNMLERIFSLEEYGSKLSSKLSKKKSETLREIEVLEARMNEYPDISTDKKNELQKSVEELKKEVEEINKKLEIENKKAVENEKIYSLIQDKEKIEKRLSELKGKEEHIKNLTESVDKAEKANIVMPEIEKKNSVEKEIEELKNQEKLFKEELENQNSDLKYKKEEFEEVSHQKENIEFITDVRKTIIDAIDFRKKAINCNEEVEKLKAAEKEIEKTKKKIEEEIKSIDLKIEKINAVKKDLNEKIKKNTVSVKYRELVKNGISIHRDIYRQEDKLENDSKKIKNLEEGTEGVKSFEKKLDVLEGKIKNASDEVGKIVDAIAVQEKIEVLTDKQFEKLDDIIAKLDERIIHLREDTKIYKEQDETIANEKELISKLNKEIEVFEKELKELEEKQTELEKIEGENSIRKLSEEIKIIWSKDFHKGDLCPVCNNAVEKLEIHNHIENEYEKNKELIKELQKLIADKNIAKATKETDRKNSEKKIQECEKKKNELVEKHKGEKLKDVLQERENKDKLRGEQKALSKAKTAEIEKLNKEKLEADKKYQNLKTEKVKIEESIKGIKHSISLINSEIEEVKKENKNSHSELDKIRESILEESDNKKLTFEEVDRQFFIDENKNVDEAAAAVERLTADMEKTSEQLEKQEFDKKKHEENRVLLDGKLIKAGSEKESLKKQSKEFIEEAENKKNSIDFKKLDSVIEFNYDSIDVLPGILDSFVRIIKSNFDEISKAYEELKNNIVKTEKNIETTAAKLAMQEKNMKEQTERVDDFMMKFKFDSSDEIRKYCMDENVLAVNKEEIEKYNSEKQREQAVYKQVIEKLDGKSITEEERDNQLAVKKELEAELEEKKDILSKEKYKLDEMEKNLVLVKGIEKELKEKTKLSDNIKEIDKLFQGNRFVEYLSQIYLRNIIIDASKRLNDITNGRYTLEMNDNYVFVICDNFTGGLRRAADTLSGGEVFLTSLSLALALSSQIQLKGSAPLEFFFLDEGFGTLDAELLDTVMTSLENLKSESLSVGIISHVEEIKERIPMKLEISMDDKIQSSVIKEIEE